jgi:predicted DNA-binding transcriptional regulator AlpA
MKLLSEHEAAARLGVAPRSLQRWRTEGQGPAYVRVGPRRIAYDEAELIRWVQGRRHEHLAAERAGLRAESDDERA